MCGVVGYAGDRPALEHLLGALARLEYRGYDSAGVCLVSPGRLDTVRAVGKLAALRRAVGARAAACPALTTARTGIGHTRWATHGRVTEANAHPLPAGEHDDVAIALNGIVENHAALRAELGARGARFASETDAEVVAHLVREAYAGDLEAAVAAAATRLEGHFAFVAAHRDEPGRLVGTRRRCPLVAGLGERETFLASSTAAFSHRTRRTVVVEDGEVAAITAEGLRLSGPDGRPRTVCERTLADADACTGRGTYDTYMLKEIHEQPAALAATIAGGVAPGPLDAALAGCERIVLVACGTAYHAALAGRLAIEEWAAVPCDAEVASEWRYRHPRVGPRTLVIGITQSGETADTLEALRLARRLGAPTAAITNSPDAQVTREVDVVLPTRAGLEVGVAATKTFTTQVALLALLALRTARLRATLTPVELAALTGEVRALPQKVEACLTGAGAVAAVAERHRDAPFFVYLGRHAGLPVAMEGALKLKEIAYVPAEAHGAGEMKHGPIALLGDGTPVVAIATASPILGKVSSNLQEVRARGAHVTAVITAGDPTALPVADAVLEVPPAHPLLQPVLAAIPLQLLAYEVARRRGLDVDQPRNLAKTVTVE